MNEHEEHVHEVAILTHNVFSVIRKFVAKDDLSDEGRKLLFLLSDAAHNLPLMISPNKNNTWAFSIEEIKSDMSLCHELMKKIDATAMFKGDNKKIKAKRFWFF